MFKIFLGSLDLRFYPKCFVFVFVFWERDKTCSCKTKRDLLPAKSVISRPSQKHAHCIDLSLFCVNFIQWKCIKIRCQQKCQNICFSMCDVKVSLTFTSLSLVLLLQLFYLFCSSIVINTVIVTAGNFEP